MLFSWLLCSHYENGVFSRHWYTKALNIVPGYSSPSLSTFFKLALPGRSPPAIGRVPGAEFPAESTV